MITISSRPAFSRQMELQNRKGERANFPPVHSVLWDTTPKGQPVAVSPTQYRNFSVSLEEKTLRLAVQLAQNSSNLGESYHCTLQGSVYRQPDGQGMDICVERVVDATQTPNNVSEMSLPFMLRNGSSKMDMVTTEDFIKCIQTVHEGCSRQKLDLARFVSLRACASFNVSEHSTAHALHVDLVAPATVFRATPVALVPVVPSALTKHLASPPVDTEATPKSGYLTMDPTRKLKLVIDSDRQAATLPLVGIWVSGVALVHDCFVWAACLRYLHNAALQDRVCVSPEPFLLVVYSPLRSRPEFYQMETQDSRPDLQIELHSAFKTIRLPNGGSARPGSPFPIDLDHVTSGDKANVFHAALEFSEDLLKYRRKRPAAQDTARSPVVVAEDLSPRSRPSPHAAQVPSARPSVPDVSFLQEEEPSPRVPLPATKHGFPAGVSRGKSNSTEATAQRRAPLKPVNRTTAGPTAASADARGINSHAHAQCLGLHAQGNHVFPAATSVPSQQQHHGFENVLPPGGRPEQLIGESRPHSARVPMVSGTPQFQPVPGSLVQPGPHVDSQLVAAYAVPQSVATESQGITHAQQQQMTSLTSYAHGNTIQAPQQEVAMHAQLPVTSLQSFPQQSGRQVNQTLQHNNVFPGYVTQHLQPNHVVSSHVIPSQLNTSHQGNPHFIGHSSPSIPTVAVAAAHGPQSSPAMVNPQVAPPHDPRFGSTSSTPHNVPNQGAGNPFQQPHAVQQQQQQQQQQSEVGFDPASTTPKYVSGSPAITNPLLQQTADGLPLTGGSPGIPPDGSPGSASVVSSSRSSTSSQLPAEVLELMRAQQQQILELKQQVEQLTLQQHSAGTRATGSTNGVAAGTKEVRATGTQMSARSSPVKVKPEVPSTSSIATNTSALYPPPAGADCVLDVQPSSGPVLHDSAVQARGSHNNSAETPDSGRGSHHDTSDSWQTLNNTPPGCEQNAATTQWTNQQPGNLSADQLPHNVNRRSKAASRSRRSDVDDLDLSSASSGSDPHLQDTSSAHHQAPLPFEAHQATMPFGRIPQNSSSPVHDQHCTEAPHSGRVVTPHGDSVDMNRTLHDERYIGNDGQLDASVADYRFRRSASYEPVLDEDEAGSGQFHQGRHQGAFRDSAPELRVSASDRRDPRLVPDPRLGTNMDESRDLLLGESHSTYGLGDQSYPEAEEQDEDWSDTEGDTHDSDLLQQQMLNLRDNLARALGTDETQSSEAQSPQQQYRAKPGSRKKRSPHVGGGGGVGEQDMRKRTERQLKKLGVDLEALRAPPTPGRDATVFGDQSTLYLDPAMLPRAQYATHLFDTDSDRSSCEADAVALKYLKDEELAEHAQMRSGGRRRGGQRRQPAGGVGGGGVTMYGMSPSNMSMHTKAYLERYGLAGDAASDETESSSDGEKSVEESRRCDGGGGARILYEEGPVRRADRPPASTSGSSSGASGSDGRQRPPPPRPLHNRVPYTTQAPYLQPRTTTQHPPYHRQYSTTSDTILYRTPDRYRHHSRDTDIDAQSVRAASDHTELHFGSDPQRRQRYPTGDQAIDPRDLLRRPAPAFYPPAHADLRPPSHAREHRRRSDRQTLDPEKIKQLPKLK